MYELVLKFKSLGLTEYEAKAYLALLEKAELTAEEVSKLSEVPLPRVYGILEQLEEKGFVKVIGGRPRRFEAVEPKEAFQNYIEYRRKLLSKEISDINAMFSSLQPRLEELYYKHRLRIKPGVLLQPLKDLYEMEAKTRSLISNAVEELLIFTELFSWFPKVEAYLKNALKRGVSVKVLMCTSTLQSRRIAEKLFKMGAKVRIAPEKWYPTRGTIADKSKLLFLIWAAEEEERYWKPVLYRPHYTENRGLICVFIDAFEKRWREGSPLH
ncbi:MAG TPA: TrmB family transcriptional regulator [Candidatus Bathyarchaeota archaeon]|nr:TrmB family transcriptional regulator [Candidatus Bathyarchaeota archaeon]